MATYLVVCESGLFSENTGSESVPCTYGDQSILQMR